MQNAKLRLKKVLAITYNDPCTYLVQVARTGLDVCPQQLNVRELINCNKLTCETKKRRTEFNIEPLQIPE